MNRVYWYVLKLFPYERGSCIFVFGCKHYSGKNMCLKKKQNTPRPSEHPPVMGGKMSKRVGGIKGCKYKTYSWPLNRFSDADNIGPTV